MAGFGEQKDRKEKIPQQKPQSSGDSLVKKAINHHIKGDLKNAEKAYRAAIDSGLSNIAAFSNLGIICQTSKRTEEAISLYKKAIQINPNDPDAYTNLGGLYKDLGDLNQALSSTLKSLKLNPDNPDALINLGGIYQNLGDLNQALSSTLKSLELKPDNPDAHMNLGSIYKDLGNLDQALASTLKSLDLKPDNPTTLINLGSIYKDLGNLDQALSSTLKSLEHNPDNPTALTNLGSIYQDLGNLDQAIASTLKSIELKPENPDAHMNLGIIYETLNKLDSALESHAQSAKLIVHAKEESSLTSLINTSIILIQMNRIEEAQKALSKALKIALGKEISIKYSSTKNKKNNNAYLSFLSKLIPKIPRIDSAAEAKILHLGESHCLTFTNQTIEIKGKKYLIKPSLLKGAKAFHLNEDPRTTPQKMGFEKRLQQNLDYYEYIFLSFGEIDCREDEGILLHCKKTGEAIQEASKTTAAKYHNWTSNALSRHKKKLVYFGTPAPFKTYTNNEESSEKNEQRLLSITVFNTTLAKQCQESGSLFADVYKLTSGQDGYNNNDWMIDSRHLKPEALNELMKSLQA